MAANRSIGRPERPPVSVIMPVRNEARYIRESLEAVMSQEYATDQIEVIIADGDSTDGTRALIDAIIAEFEGFGPRVMVIANPAQHQAAGLNAAIRAAHGAYIVRVDGHTCIPPGYVERCIDGLQATGAWNYGGAQVFSSDTFPGRIIAAACRSPFAVPSAFRVGQQAGPVDTVYLGAWPRAAFETVGLFDETMSPNEDYEFNYRLRKAGGTVYFDPTLRSTYYGRDTFPALAGQYFRYGRAKARMLTRHPASGRARQFVAPLFVLAQFGLLLPTIRPFALALDAIYLLLALYFAIGAAFSDGIRWRGVPRIFFSFPCLHIAWGVGFWVGLLTSLRPPRASQ
jgi:glycosyltransferase involved in cell wall biosynthesis